MQWEIPDLFAYKFKDFMTAFQRNAHFNNVQLDMTSVKSEDSSIYTISASVIPNLIQANHALKEEREALITEEANKTAIRREEKRIAAARSENERVADRAWAGEQIKGYNAQNPGSKAMEQIEKTGLVLKIWGLDNDWYPALDEQNNPVIRHFNSSTNESTAYGTDGCHHTELLNNQSDIAIKKVPEEEWYRCSRTIIPERTQHILKALFTSEVIEYLKDFLGDGRQGNWRADKILNFPKENIIKIIGLLNPDEKMQVCNTMAKYIVENSKAWYTSSNPLSMSLTDTQKDHLQFFHKEYLKVVNEYQESFLQVNNIFKQDLGNKSSLVNRFSHSTTIKQNYQWLESERQEALAKATQKTVMEKACLILKVHGYGGWSPGDGVLFISDHGSYRDVPETVMDGIQVSIEKRRVQGGSCKDGSICEKDFTRIAQTKATVKIIADYITHNYLGDSNNLSSNNEKINQALNLLEPEEQIQVFLMLAKIIKENPKKLYTQDNKKTNLSAIQKDHLEFLENACSRVYKNNASRAEVIKLNYPKMAESAFSRPATFLVNFGIFVAPPAETGEDKQVRNQKLPGGPGG